MIQLLSLYCLCIFVVVILSFCVFLCPLDCGKFCFLAASISSNLRASVYDGIKYTLSIHYETTFNLRLEALSIPYVFVNFCNPYFRFASLINGSDILLPKEEALYNT
uniref:Putative ovule protein n=1 Tax=Solanum chacoense TaxID=4108 RepID=A0A0V0HYN0_SOLCH